MNNRKSSVNWNELRTKISAFDIPVYPFECFTIGELLGLGAAMAVFEGKLIANGIEKDVALKKHMKLDQKNLTQRVADQVLHELRHEIRLMQRLKFHPNVVQLIGVTFEGNKPILLVELGNHTLDNYLYERHHEGKTASWFEKIMLCMDVLRAIQGLHAAGIVHGDLKGENILLFIKPPGILTAKISLSSTLTSSNREISRAPHFMAPECMRAHPHLSQFHNLQTQDVFGFGLVTYQIANNGAIPYEEDGEDSNILEVRATDPELKTVLAQLPPDTPAEIRQVIIITTKFMPTDRTSLNEVEQILRNLLNPLPSQPLSSLQSNHPDIKEVHFRDEIPKLSRITTRLNLKEMIISKETFSTLAKSLKQYNTTIELDFNGKPVEGNTINLSGALYLAELLRQDTTVTLLDLKGNFIGDLGAQALAESLKENTTLTQLNLRLNSIGHLGAQALAKSLKKNTSLTQLDLSMNSIRDFGAHILAKSLKENTTLTQLNLRCNSIGELGAQALAESLKYNTNLTQLNLYNNSIGHLGAQTLAESLNENTTLTQLDLSSMSESLFVNDEPLMQPNPQYKPNEGQELRPESADIEKMNVEEIIALPDTARKQHADTLKSRGNKYFSAKKYEKAIQLYSQAIAFRKDAVFYSNRAACYAQEEKHELVIADCDEALKMDPLYVKALNRRASAYEQIGNLDEALYSYTAACIVDEFKSEAASTSMERVLKKLAETKAKEILKTKKPRLPSPTFVSAYLDSFRADPTPIGITDGEMTGTVYYNRAREALKTKQFDEAHEYFKKAVDMGCEDDATQACALNMRGTFTFLMGDADGALKDFNKAIELHKENVQTWIKRASIFMEKGDPTEAFNQFGQAIRIDPTNPDVYYHRGQCIACFPRSRHVLRQSMATINSNYSLPVNFVTGDFSAASAEYTQSIMLDPDFLYAHIQLGVAQYKMGSIPQAMVTFQIALKQFKTSADVNNYYGELLLDQSKFDEALERFEKAIELEPENPLPYINKALLVYQVKDDSHAAEILLRKALEVDPNCDVAIANLAQFMLQQQRAAESLDFFEMSVELARTEAELANAISYREAAVCQIRFAQDYPQVKASRF